MEIPLVLPTVVSSRRTPVPIKYVPENITVITRKQIQELPANDPAEVLEYVSDVDADARTKFGHFRPVSIQGSESRQVLVMVDGIPFNTQVSGQADILTALPLRGIEQIEITKGAASSVWGSSAGGVIDLVTRAVSKSTPPKSMIQTRFSQFNTRAYDFETEGSVSDFGYSFSGTYLDAGGVRPKITVGREDVMQKKFLGKIVAEPSDMFSVTTTYGYAGDTAHEGVFPSFPFRDEISYLARYGQVSFEAHPSEDQDLELSLNMNRQSIQSEFLLSPSDFVFSTADSRDLYYGSGFKSVTRFDERNSLVAGYDLGWHTLKTTFMARSRDIRIQAPYANYQMTWAPVSVTAGVRYDQNEEFGEQLSPSAGFVFDIPFLPETSFQSNIARGFSAPPLLWKYFEDIAPGVSVNNPDIRPERALSVQAGFKGRIAKILSWSFSVYRSKITDAIATVLNANNKFIKENFNKFRQQGLETDLELALSKELAFTFAANVNDVINQETGDEVSGRGVTKKNYRLGLRWKHAAFGAAVFGKYDHWDSSHSSQVNDRKFIFDMRLNYTIPKHWIGEGTTLFVNVFNLTNSKYWSDFNFPSPRRYFEGGVALAF